MARVLVVDDEKGMRISLQKFLSLEGHEVFTAEDAAKATQILHSRHFDIVVTDIVLPDVTGLDLLLALRSDFPTLKIILITGQPSVESAAKAVRMGAYDYLAKPINRKDICKVVDSASKIKILEDENRKHREELEQRVRERTRKVLEYSERLKEIAENTKKFPISNNEHDLAEMVLDLLAKNMGAEGGSFFLRDGNTLRLLCAIDPGHQVDAIPLPPKEGSVIWQIFQKKEAFAVNDINKNQEIQKSGWNGYKDGSLLALPFTSSDGEIHGMVTLHNKTVPPFSKQDIELGRIIASHTMGNLETIKANRSQRESETRYKELSERSRTGIFLHSEGQLVYVNNFLIEMMGFEGGVLPPDVNKAVIDFIHPKDKALVKQRIEARSRGEEPPSHYEVRLIDIHGKTIWVDMSISTLTHNGKPAIMGNMINITDRKNAEKEIEFQAKLIDEFKDSIIVFDLDGQITYVNDVELSITEFTREEILQLNIKDVLQPEEVKNDTSLSLEVAFKEAIKEGEWRGDLSILSKSGRLRILRTKLWLLKDEENEPYGVLGLGCDITEQKSLEQAYEALVNKSLQGLAIFQDENIVFTNTAFEKITGYNTETLKALSGNNFFEVIHPEDREYFSKTIIPAASEQNEELMSEIRLIRSDGSIRWVELFIAPIRFKGRPALQIAFYDNTARKEAEYERKKLEEELRYSQKMEAIGRLAGGVAHDFNNLLTGISGNASLAKYDLDESSTAYDSLNEIVNAARRASSLTNQLLTFSRKQVVDARVINLNETIKSIETILKSMLGEDILLEIILPQSNINIHADPTQIEQILLNLVVNSRDAMPNGGSIILELTTKRWKEDNRTQHTSLEPGNYAVIKVTDSGMGMTEETISHIFEPFFTTRRKQGGNGLGMSTVYGIVKQHKGRIEINSRINEGSEFRVYLPVSDQEEEEIILPSYEQEIIGGKETILVAEDDAIVKNITVKILEKLGYKVLHAANGEEALEIADKYGSEIDMLLTDIVMPGMDGFELAKETKNRHNIYRVIYTSGYSENKIKNKEIRLDESNFIKKPFTPEHMASKVRQILDTTNQKI